MLPLTLGLPGLPVVLGLVFLGWVITVFFGWLFGVLFPERLASVAVTSSRHTFLSIVLAVLSLFLWPVIADAPARGDDRRAADRHPDAVALAGRRVRRPDGRDLRARLQAASPSPRRGAGAAAGRGRFAAHRALLRRRGRLLHLGGLGASVRAVLRARRLPWSSAGSRRSAPGRFCSPAPVRASAERTRGDARRRPPWRARSRADPRPQRRAPLRPRWGFSPCAARAFGGAHPCGPAGRSWRQRAGAWCAVERPL